MWKLRHREAATCPKEHSQEVAEWGLELGPSGTQTKQTRTHTSRARLPRLGSPPPPHSTRAADTPEAPSPTLRADVPVVPEHLRGVPPDAAGPALRIPHAASQATRRRPRHPQPAPSAGPSPPGSRSRGRACTAHLGRAAHRPAAHRPVHREPRAGVGGCFLGVSWRN